MSNLIVIASAAVTPYITTARGLLLTMITRATLGQFKTAFARMLEVIFDYSDKVSTSWWDTLFSANEVGVAEMRKLLSNFRPILQKVLQENYLVITMGIRRFTEAEISIISEIVPSSILKTSTMYPLLSSMIGYNLEDWMQGIITLKRAQSSDSDDLANDSWTDSISKSWSSFLITIGVGGIDATTKTQADGPVSSKWRSDKLAALPPSALVLTIIATAGGDNGPLKEMQRYLSAFAATPGMESVTTTSTSGFVMAGALILEFLKAPLFCALVGFDASEQAAEYSRLYDVMPTLKQSIGDYSQTACYAVGRAALANGRQDLMMGGSDV